MRSVHRVISDLFLISFDFGAPKLLHTALGTFLPIASNLQCYSWFRDAEALLQPWFSQAGIKIRSNGGNSLVFRFRLNVVLETKLDLSPYPVNRQGDTHVLCLCAQEGVQIRI